MANESSLHVLRVKIWLESSHDESVEQEWRGEVQTLDSGDVAFFRTLKGFEDALRKLGLLTNT